MTDQIQKRFQVGYFLFSHIIDPNYAGILHAITTCPKPVRWEDVEKYADIESLTMLTYSQVFNIHSVLDFGQALVDYGSTSQRSNGV